jgi:hypothetical protein
MYLIFLGVVVTHDEGPPRHGGNPRHATRQARPRSMRRATRGLDEAADLTENWRTD